MLTTCESHNSQVFYTICNQFTALGTTLKINIKLNMGSSVSTLSADILKKLIKEMTPEMKDALTLEIVKKCKDILKKYPSNLCCKYTIEYLESEEGKSLSNEDAQIFFKCICTGIENPETSIGCYAMTPDDYKKFHGFFEKVIRDYHGVDSGQKFDKTKWDISDIVNYDVTTLGLDDLSVRVRVGRNLVRYNLPGAMDRNERIKFEIDVLPIFDRLKSKWGGQVFSLTPHFGNNIVNPNLISKDKYQELVEGQVLFKDMSNDPFLRSAGISDDWPYGRGCWQSDDKMRTIWFGEEDQLRIICMKKCNNIVELFKSLKEILNLIEEMDGIEFAMDEKYGYITSCPSNLGKGIRASVHLQVPNVTSNGCIKKAKEICEPLGLSVRGLGGERNDIKSDGIIDISLSTRFFIGENEIIERLYKGISSLLLVENEMIKNKEKNDRVSEEKDPSLMTEVNDCDRLNDTVEKLIEVAPSPENTQNKIGNEQPNAASVTTHLEINKDEEVKTKNEISNEEINNIDNGSNKQIGSNDGHLSGYDKKISTTCEQSNFAIEQDNIVSDKSVDSVTENTVSSEEIVKHDLTDVEVDSATINICA